MEQAEKVTEERSGSKPHDKKETAFPALLAHFFSLHAPSKQGNVAAILKRYHGKESELITFLETKYKCSGFFLSKQLDVSGSYFDPEEALLRQPSRVQLPYPTVRPLDNIARCKLLLPQSSEFAVRPDKLRVAARKRPSSTAARRASGAGDGGGGISRGGGGAGGGAGAGVASRASTVTSQSPPQQPPPLPHAATAARPAPPPLQQPQPASVSSKGHRQKRRRAARYDLQEISDQFQEGPLRVLHDSMRQRSRIRVVIRRIDGVRGVCVGFLMAFDKHMNMVLQDVDEEFVDVHA